MAGELATAVRTVAQRLLGSQPNSATTDTEQGSADEMKRRLDATRERLKRETPPTDDPPAST